MSGGNAEIFCIPEDELTALNVYVDCGIAEFSKMPGEKPFGVVRSVPPAHSFADSAALCRSPDGLFLCQASRAQPVPCDS